jgi:hypothetical protein
MSFTDYTEGKVADEIFGATAFAAPGTLHVGLHSAYPNEAGSGAELTGNGYARVAVTNNTTNWPNYSGGQKLNGNPVTFPTATGSNWLEAVAVSIWDAPTSGNMIARGWLGSDPGKVFTAKAVGDTLTIPGHSLVVDDKVAVIAIPGGTIPTGIVEGTIYFVKTVSSDDITLAATQGGATIDLTTTGAGLIKKVIPKTVQVGDTLSFPASSLVITLD